MWFRGLLIAVTALLWGLFIRLAFHTSHVPAFLGHYSGQYLAGLGVALAIAIGATATNFPPVYVPLFRIRFQLIWVLLVSPFLGLVLLEGTLRAFNLFGSRFYGEVGRYMRVVVPDDLAVYKNPAGLHEVFHGFEIDTNEFGFRGGPLSPKSPDRRRILVLGDSVTLGWGVREEDTFCSRLEVELRQHGLNVQTINTGVSGYNTYQELMVLRRYGDLLSPDLVMLVYVDNDIELESNPFSQIRPIPSPWRDPLGAMAALLRKTRIYEIGYQLWPVLVSHGSVSELRNSPGWKRSMDSLAQMAAYCRARSIPFVTFHFRMLPDPVSDQINEELSAISAREHFQYSDMLPWFAHRNVFRLVNSYLDSHPNAQGHQLIADGMTRVLLDHPSLLPTSPVSVAEASGGHRNVLGGPERNISPLGGK